MEDEGKEYDADYFKKIDEDIKIADEEKKKLEAEEQEEKEKLEKKVKTIDDKEVAYEEVPY